VFRDVLADGVSCGLHRIERLMRRQALRARPRRRRRPPDLGERPADAVAPNVLDVGCTNGYSSALLARLARSVMPLEEQTCIGAACGRDSQGRRHKQCNDRDRFLDGGLAGRRPLRYFAVARPLICLVGWPHRSTFQHEGSRNARAAAVIKFDFSLSLVARWSLLLDPKHVCSSSLRSPMIFRN
jgi:transposase InsO family protein